MKNVEEIMSGANRFLRGEPTALFSETRSATVILLVRQEYLLQVVHFH